MSSFIIGTVLPACPPPAPPKKNLHCNSAWEKQWELGVETLSGEGVAQVWLAGWPHEEVHSRKREDTPINH